MRKSKKLCHGCHDDVYNHGCGGSRQCWGFKSAKVVTRYKIGTWTLPTQNGAFTKVRVLNCYKQNGSCFHRELPKCAKNVREIKNEND